MFKSFNLKIFITGGTGFIGRYVVKKLKSEGNTLLLLSRRQKTDSSLDVDIVEGDLSDIKSWKDKVEDFKPEATIHLAWEGIPDYGPRMSIKNLNYGLNLINFLAEIGCKTILATGSCWEYGGQSRKLKEDMLPKPFNAFAAAKNSLHHLGKEIAKENNMQFIWTRLFYVYGPGQKETSIIPYLLGCLKEGRVPEIKNPSARNDFIYVEDIAEAIAVLVKNCRRSGVYNIGSGHLTSVQDIIKTISNSYGLKNRYKNVAPKTTEILATDFYADISKIKKEIGWKPKTNIKEGIQKMIGKNYEPR